MPKNNMRVLFTAGAGRSGTTTLSEIFRLNVRNCIALHEPWVDPKKIGVPHSRLNITGNKILEGAGFGDALKWYDTDNVLLDRLMALKAGQIKQLQCAVYFEANHAFLKSMCDLLVRHFPGLGIIHLTRSPLEVARSFTNRIRSFERNRFLAGFARWNMVPGYKKNCLPDPPADASPIQYYLWMWIELELRLVRFLKRHPETIMFELDTKELNNRLMLMDMFKCFNLDTKVTSIKLPKVLNTNPELTEVMKQDCVEAARFLKTMPLESLLQLRKPYNLLRLRGSY